MNNAKSILLVTGAAAFVGGAVFCLAITTVVAQHAQTPQSHWTREQLDEPGYGTPAAALKTLLWGINNGDSATFLASLSPEASAKVQTAWSGKLDHILGAYRQGLGKTTDFQIVSDTSTNDEVILDLLSTVNDGRKYDRKFTFKKFGDDWKCEHVFPLPNIE